MSVSRARPGVFCVARARRRRVGQRDRYLRGVIWVLEIVEKKAQSNRTALFPGLCRKSRLPIMLQESTKMAAPTHHNLAHSQTTPNKLATFQKWLQTIEKPLQTPQEPRGASFLRWPFSEARRPCPQKCTTSSTPPSTISRASPRRSTSASATNWTAARSGPRPTAPRPLPGKLPTASRVRTRTVCSDRARRTRSSTRRTVRPRVPQPAWTRRRRVRVGSPHV